MDLENTGKDWMNEAPLLSAIERKNPFTVPKDYFNGLQETIKSRCLVEDARFSDEEEFSVPQSYFQSLPSQITSRIAEENIRNIAPSEGFVIPADYFNEFKQRLLARISEEDKPKEAVVKPIRSRNWIGYAAAASVTVVLGSVLLLNNKNSSFEYQLERIPEQEIINYLQVHSDMGDTPLIMESLGQDVDLGDLGNEISEADLEEYINTSL